jgi:RNA 2',3'-cyclic 3'-phosphodiesterase
MSLTAGPPEPGPELTGSGRDEHRSNGARAVRTFVAAWPDAATKERLAGLDLGPEKGLRPVGPERWHVTLRFLGEVDESLVPALTHALRAAVAAVPGPVRCRLGPGTAWFTGVRVLQVPATGLDELAAVVRHATLPLVAAPAPGEPPFNGHLTLARAKGRRRASPAARALAGIPFEASFPVDHVDLVVSTPAPHGHIYATVGDAPLGTGS